MRVPIPHPSSTTRSSGTSAPRAGRWTAPAALGFITFALVALALLPFAGERYTSQLREELTTVAESGRSLVTEIQLTLALQGSALHDYVETGDTTFVARYREADQREMAARRRLAPLVEGIGPEVAERFHALGDLEARWRDSVERVLQGTAGMARARHPLQAELYEDVLVAAARLDEALDAAAQIRRRRIAAAERRQRAVAVVLVGVTLGAVVVVAWLGGRLSAYATELEERRRALEQVMESKARLTRGISHDLKNPLNAIDGHAALLADGIRGELTESQKQSVARIRLSVRALLTLIDDLLELSRAEVGELRIERRSTDVRQVVQDAVEEHRAEALVARHALTTEPCEDLPTLETDPARVRQVLSNLLSNAIKYTPPGGQVSVRAHVPPPGSASRPGTWVAIDVADTGPGIPAEQLEAVFTEFTRLDGTGRPGAGLGLAIARRIARLLGGDVTAESEPGRGSRFTLWLPAGRGAPQD